jgi:PHP family Zn ribbon phosphoesterase
MSGGNWDYAYCQLDEIADRLLLSNDPYRFALGKQMQLTAIALKAIEWVDSGDCCYPDEIEPIKKALAFQGDQAVADAAIEMMEDIIKLFRAGAENG